MFAFGGEKWHKPKLVTLFSYRWGSHFLILYTCHDMFCNENDEKVFKKGSSFFQLKENSRTID